MKEEKKQTKDEMPQTLMLEIERRNRCLSKNRRTHGKNSGIHTTAEIALNPGKHFRVSTITAGCLVEVNYFSSGKITKKKKGQMYSLMKQSCQGPCFVTVRFTKLSTNCFRSSLRTEQFHYVVVNQIANFETKL